MSGFTLPNEETAGPELPGVTASAPSFKAPRNLQAAFLANLGQVDEDAPEEADDSIEPVRKTSLRVRV